MEMLNIDMLLSLNVSSTLEFLEIKPESVKQKVYAVIINFKLIHFFPIIKYKVFLLSPSKSIKQYFFCRTCADYLTGKIKFQYKSEEAIFFCRSV